jgi:site-specific DNA recombinase
MEDLKVATKKSIRFAALIRVSTERQEKQGESLRTQRTQIENAVDSLGGKISAWYGGQEHGTPGWEKAEVNRLLSDASKQRKKFDAVMVAHPDRWSRDNLDSEKGLRKLQANGIRFFCLTTEHELSNPQARLFLSMSAAIGGYQAATQMQKSLENKIARAKRGIPTGGSLPFGRTYDKKTETWGVDKRKKTIIQNCAKRYLVGESIKELAQEYGMGHSTLHLTLTRKCGDRFPISFKSETLAIDEIVTIEIPRLLPERTIKRIAEKMKANKTYTHGQNKHQYLLSRMIFCSECGQPLTGQFNKEFRYYRHMGNNCLKGMVKAALVENVVMRQLFETFGNPTKLEQALSDAFPNRDKLEDLQKRESHLLTEIQKAKKAKDRILGMIEKDIITDDDAAKRLGGLNDKERKYQDEIERIQETLAKLPALERIRTISKQMSVKFRKRVRVSAKKAAIYYRVNRDFDGMSWEEKRQLAEMVFGGKTVDGSRMGVYVSSIPKFERKRPRHWAYEIRGHLIDGGGWTGLPNEAFLEGAATMQQELVTSSASS